MTNKELISLMRGLQPNWPPNLVIAGEVGSDIYTRIENPELWNVLEPRILDFFYLKSALHEKYGGTWSFPETSDGYFLEIEAAYISKKTTSKCLFVNLKATRPLSDGTAAYSWTVNEKIKLLDFYDSSEFVRRIGPRLRETRLKKLRSKVEKLSKQLDSMRKEIGLLEKEEGN